MLVLRLFCMQRIWFIYLLVFTVIDVFQLFLDRRLNTRCINQHLFCVESYIYQRALGCLCIYCTCNVICFKYCSGLKYSKFVKVFVFQHAFRCKNRLKCSFVSTYVYESLSVYYFSCAEIAGKQKHARKVFYLCSE